MAFPCFEAKRRTDRARKEARDRLWTESIVTTLKRHAVRLVTYLPDFIVQRVLTLRVADPAFRLLPVAREEGCVESLTGRTCLWNPAENKGHCGPVSSRTQFAISWL